MALCFRLASAGLGKQILNLSRCKLAMGALSSNNPIKGSAYLNRGIAVTMANRERCSPDVQGQNHDERNMKIGRPLSPHLTVYSIQLTSFLSISHRITGCILAAQISGFGIASLCLSEEFNYYAQSMDEWGTIPIMLIKLAMALPFSYHFVNGFRHLAWDFGLFLTVKEVYQTGYAAVAGTALMTVFLLFL